LTNFILNLFYTSENKILSCRTERKGAKLLWWACFWIPSFS